MINSKHELYSVWKNMRRRCNYQEHNSYKNYGGRGIEVCKEWDDSFEKFEDAIDAYRRYD